MYIRFKFTHTSAFVHCHSHVSVLAWIRENRKKGDGCQGAILPRSGLNARSPFRSHTPLPRTPAPLPHAFTLPVSHAG
ncbi:hypothetical protein POVWA2_050920 [Plasmodium ovale wallikeri]|uniref:Uncharacterized protein n=1 Tax=Plasmodium ovale wallikeri TaxID=864142 RepID=A0A1A8ZMJ8_PLAOA|nr:hypothetical protein POVWA1_051660 [Plasmodium ovale wallikeri]SBT45926.1 hypothetical protein POVWA2_050920 [Plasmodium ovale wallikeri]